MTVQGVWTPVQARTEGTAGLVGVLGALGAFASGVAMAASGVWSHALAGGAVVWFALAGLGLWAKNRGGRRSARLS